VNKKAFTLLELLISLSISSFIILGVTQGFRTAQKNVAKAQTRMQVNKSVCLFFNQIERDFNTIIMFDISEEIKKEDKKKEKEKEKKKKKKKKPVFFLAESDVEGEAIKIGEEKYEPFKSVSFVNTNPLQVWGETKSRLVRVGYELVKNNLYRKESTNILNEKLEVKEEAKKEEKIKKNLIATNIKEMSITYTGTESDKKFFSWEKTKNTIPKKIEIIVTMFGIGKRDEKRFSCIIPVISTPIKKTKKEKKRTAKKAKPRPRR
jgi:prepilin-type N-terminal cleavage/methylation domain-containing protein